MPDPAGTTGSPADKGPSVVTATPPADKIGVGPNAWPKEARDGYLKRMNEVADALKAIKDIQGTVGELARNQKNYESIIASLSQERTSRGTVDTEHTQPYRPGQPPEVTATERSALPALPEFDPWDPDAVDRYFTAREMRMWNAYTYDQGERDKQYKQMASLAVYWGVGANRLFDRDPELKVEDLSRIIEQANKMQTTDLDVAYRTVFADRIFERERATATEAGKKAAEDEAARARTTEMPAPVLPGEGFRMPRHASEGRPKTYGDATRQAIVEGRGKVVTDQ